MSEDDKQEKEILLKKRYAGHMIFIGTTTTRHVALPDLCLLA
jgi:hypothetical protein